MGYDVEEIYRLEWDDRPGALVRARSLGTGEMLAWSERNARAREAGQRRDNYDSAVELLSSVIVDWTLERRGQPLPIHDVSELADDDPERKRLADINAASLRLIGHRFLLGIFSAYMGESVEVPQELGKDSTSGGSYPAELQTMEALSYSPPSSDTPEQS